MALGAGETGTARVTFKLPRAPHPPAGPLDVSRRRRRRRRPRAEVRATLEVAAFVDVFATLEPLEAGAAATSSGWRTAATPPFP